MAETETATPEPSNLVEVTAEIVSAYVGNNTIAAADLPSLITSVADQLGRLAQEHAEPVKPKPAVPINRSVRKQGIVCLVCGQPQKLLKRHLAAMHDLTPEDYRDLFGLKRDYPMVAPDYAAQRSALAKKVGLGRKPPAPKARKKATSSRR